MTHPISPPRSRLKTLTVTAVQIVAVVMPLVGVHAQQTLPVLNAELDPPRQWVAWEESDLSSITTSAEDQEKSTAGLLDGNPRTVALLPTLEGSTTTLTFKQPREIKELAFIQGGMKDWALPAELKLRVDGQDAVIVKLQDAPGKIQSVPLGKTVQELEIQVVGAYKDAERKRAWGGFSGLGEALFGPVEKTLEAMPLQDHQRELKVTIDSPVDTTASVYFTLGRSNRNLRFDHPSLDLRAGTHVYTVSIDDLVPAEAYGYDIRPRHLEKFIVNGPDGTIPIRLISFEPVEERVAETQWESLPPIEFPTREIDGEVWTEGHSYRTAGRFGNSTYNGLVNEVISGNWIRTYTANGNTLLRRQDFDFSIKGFDSDDTDSTDELWRLKRTAWDPEREKVDVNWTTMVLERTGENGKDSRITAGLLAPGLLIDTPDTMTFSSRGGGNLPFRSGAPDEDEARFLTPSASDAGKPMIGPSAILTSEGLITSPQTISNLKEPWFVAIWGIADGEPTFWGDKAVAMLFTADTSEAIEWSASALNLPAARWGLSSAFHGLLNDGWKPEAVSERARLLTRMLRTYPVECREFYRVEEDVVKIQNEFSYDRWGVADWQAADYAPIPPIYSWAKDSLDWEGIPEGSSLSETADIRTPIGPFRWVDGDTLDYTLPRIPARHAAWPRREEFAATYEAMAEQIAKNTAEFTGARENNHPWVRAYHLNWSQGLAGGSIHEPVARERLLEIARANAELLYSPSSWILRKELFTQEPYQIYGWLDMSTLPIMFGDPNSNVGQAAYSLYLYALYSGDWEMVREFWPRIMETLRVFEVLNDWAIPGTTSREAVKYGAIDMDTIAYAGVIAMRRMAEALGEEEDLERIAYMEAKIAANTALRLNFDDYLDPENRHPRLFGIGFAEDGPAMERAAPNSTRGMDKIAMCLTWTGEMPEMYDFYLHILGPEFFTEFQRDFMDVHFSGWREMSHNHSRSAAHIANRARLPDWPADGLKSDVEKWLSHTNSDFTHYRSSGMFGAYTGHETQVFLNDWAPARFVNLEYDLASRTLVAEMENEDPFQLVLQSPTPVVECKLDGIVQPLDVIESAEGSYVISLPHGGKIDITFAESTP